MDNYGFTLLELLITLMIIALLIALGGPNLAIQYHHTRVKTVTLNLLEALELTRTQAVASNTRTTIKARGTWSNGWDLFIDSNGNGDREEDEKLLLTATGVENVKISASQPVRRYISYVGTGESRLQGQGEHGAFQAGRLTICPQLKGRGYQLIVARGGRVRMHEISAELCASQAD